MMCIQSGSLRYSLNIACDLIAIASKIIDNLGERQVALQEAAANATDQDQRSSEQLLGQFTLLRIALVLAR